jgi:DNA-binding GntR family transcriptional regulator
MTARYLEIVAELQDDIIGGKYPVGSMLPTEGDLSAYFEVSRFTVREAFRLLSEKGLVQRRQGTRTTIISNEVKPQYRAEFSTMEQTIDFAHDFSPRYLDIEEDEIIEVRGRAARFLGCRPGKEWRVLRGPRRDGQSDEIVAYCELFLWPELEGDNFDPARTIAGQMAKKYSLDVTEIQVELSAISLTEIEAGMLDAEVGTPGLQVVRRFMIASGRAFEVTRNVYPGEFVNYSLKFKRRDATEGELP